MNILFSQKKKRKISSFLPSFSSPGRYMKEKEVLISQPKNKLTYMKVYSCILKHAMGECHHCFSFSVFTS